MLRRTSVWGLAVWLLSAAVAGPAHACTCALTPVESLLRRPVVVFAEVVAATTSDSLDLRVLHVYRGRPRVRSAILTVRWVDCCNPADQRLVGLRGVFFLWTTEPDGALTSSLCGLMDSTAQGLLGRAGFPTPPVLPVVH